MKNEKNKKKKLSLALKVQLVTAVLFTLAIPVLAWFAYQERIEAFTKVKEPPSISIASGGADPALYITLENIDVNTAGHEKWVVFSVEPGKYQAYDIQLSHTTNIPFTYELYRIHETANGTIEYTDHTRTEGVETKLKYSVMTDLPGTEAGKLDLKDINPDGGATGRTLGDEGKLARYDRKNYSENNDEVNQYVKPIYSVVRKVPQLNESEDGSSDRDYYAIKVTWEVNSTIDVNDPEYWNYAFNNKETDILYISAKQSTAE